MIGLDRETLPQTSLTLGIRRLHEQSTEYASDHEASLLRVLLLLNDVVLGNEHATVLLLVR